MQWENLFDFYATLDELIARDNELELRQARERVADTDNHHSRNGDDRESWSVDNRSTRISTLRLREIPNIEIEIRYKRDQYWDRDSDYYNAWDAYYIENLPKALRDALISFVVESATVVNRTLGYAMSQDGPYREDPRSPDERDIKWINDGQRSDLEERMGVRKKSQRGGQRRLDWPQERKLAFLEVYDTMTCSVKDAASRMRPNDSFDVRTSVLQALNTSLPKAKQLPAITLRNLAKRVDQIAVDRRSAPTVANLAMEAAAEKFGVVLNDYLWKVLTSARKIRMSEHNGLGRANYEATIVS